MQESTRRDALRGAAIAAVAGIGFTRVAFAEADPSKMITQTASFRLDPAKEAEAVAALTELAKAVEANEPGVLAYIPHRVVTDPTQIVFFEVYADEAAMKNHGQQPHLAKLRDMFQTGVFKPFAEGKPVDVVKLNRVAGFAR